MCGRYTLRTKASEIAAALGLVDVPELAPRFNIAPTQSVAAVVYDATVNRRRLRMFSWGLVPPWADDPKVGNRMLNARAESIADKPSFREAFRRRRCLIVADGFYEWQRAGKAKQPFHIRRRDGKPFAMAGLYEHWQRDQRTVDSCTIVTTTPNELMASLHDRMPVILPAEAYDSWLDPRCADTPQLQNLLRPTPAAEWEAIPVGPAVNSAGNETPDCLQLATNAKPPASQNLTLF